MTVKPPVYLTQDIPASGLELLEEQCAVHAWNAPEPPPKDTIVETVADISAAGILCNVADTIDEEVLRASSNLRAVSTFSVGYDHIDLEACRELEVAVGHTPGVLSETTADLGWAIMMTAARRVIEGDQMVRESAWTGWRPKLLPGQNIHETTLGILGLGKIGTAMARRAAGFNMDVVYAHPDGKPDREAQLEEAGVSVRRVSRDELFEMSEFVSLHVPLNDETEELVGAEELRAMPDEGILVNTARGEVVDQEAIDRALSEDWIAAAALDVTVPEPLPADHPLLEHEPEKLVLTPHIGSDTVPTRNKMSRMSAENLLAGIRGEKPPHSVF